MTRKSLLSKKPIIIAGPCSISSREQILKIATEMKRLGVDALRAQLWKPRTKPDSFQGVGKAGIPWVKEIKRVIKIPVAMEVTSVEQVDLVSNLADILWVGARNMQNYELLKRISKERQPVVLKRGLIATVEEWIAAGNYIGIDRVIFCERGIRTGAQAMRFTLDLNAALALKLDHHLPVVIDPSHTAGRRDAVPHLAKAAIASGADGLIIETHYNPHEELVDKDQTLTIETFTEVVSDVKRIFSIVNH
jgi:3-deoxy-7-phosphoheptulonate synthase